MFEVKQINSKETDLLEGEISRNNSYVSSIHINVNEHGFHFGIFKGNSLIGACSFCKNKTENCSYKSVYQLHKMIVIQEQNIKQIEWDLLMHSEAFLRYNDVDLIWCDVKISEIAFFERSGFRAREPHSENTDLTFFKQMYKLL